MPPPTLADPWLASRRFGIVIDAGSSGSRLQIYSWIDPRTVAHPKGSAVSYSLPKVEKGAQDGEEWVSKVEPGLSSFEDDPGGVEKYLAPLLLHARNHIQPSLHKETPLFLLATAGMRLLAPQKQAAVLTNTCRFLKLHSNFKIDAPSSAGPCGSSVRIITGEEEGLFGWIAVNYLMDGFKGSSADRTTYGFLDMGGASTQIAFEPKQSDRSLAKKLIDVRLRLLGGEEIHHQVFVTTWLGYGTNQARERYVGQAIEDHEKHRDSGSHHGASPEDDVILDPCLPKDLVRMEAPVHTDRTIPHNLKPRRLKGTGSFEQCLQKTSPLLNTNIPCPDAPCLFNGVHVPPIDFSVSHFIGVSEYWYSSEHVFGLGGPYDFVQYERAASEFCARDWPGILKQHEESQRDGRLGGDGEVVEAGKVVGIGEWSKAVQISRLESQCFKAAWVVNVLHEGIGMPRIVDPGGNLTTDAENVAEQAERKGLGRPTFQSVDVVGDIAISWTLGKMVLEASKEVPPLSKSTRPLVDPLDDIADLVDAPVKPIRPPFFDIDFLDNHLSQHLPSSLHRSSLGFSPVLFLVYVTLLVVIFMVMCRMRAYLVATCRRILKSHSKRDRGSLAQGYTLEEGKTSSQILHPLSIRRLWRLFRSASPPSKSWPPPIAFSSPKAARHNHDVLRTPTPSSSSSSSSTPQPNGFSHGATSSSSQYLSRSPSPALGTMHEDNPNLPSRSRNTSQHNLTTFLPRPGTISRVNSAHQITVGGSPRDDW